MSRDSFEISEKGLKLPYSRFLSDAAGGYTLILVILIANLNQTPLPSWLLLPTNLNTGTIVLLTVTLILVGAPLGLVLNGVGWIMVGWTQIQFIDRWVKFSENHLLRSASTMRAFHFKLLNDCFHSKNPEPGQPTFYDQIATFDELLQVHFPDVYEAISYVSGVKQFVRNLMLISAMVGVYSLSIQAFPDFIAAGSVAALLIMFMWLLEVYQALQTMAKVYTICLEKWSDNLWLYRPFETVIADLITVAKKSP